MKIAILADIHGNIHGLDAILADIDQEQPDCILSAGDMIGCSPFLMFLATVTGRKTQWEKRVRQTENRESQWEVWAYSVLQNSQRTSRLDTKEEEHADEE